MGWVFGRLRLRSWAARDSGFLGLGLAQTGIGGGDWPSLALLFVFSQPCLSSVGDGRTEPHEDDHLQPTKGEQGAGANRRGCSVSHALRNSNPPSRLRAHPRPGGRHSLNVLLKMTSRSAIGIRIAIPFLRLLTWYKALWAVSYPQFITYSVPLQKQFFIPLTSYMWGILALVPFILLRFRVFHLFYIITLSALLLILAYDYFVPFAYPEGVASSGNAKSISNGEVVYWVSRPNFPNMEHIFMAIIMIAPLPLAAVYRRYFPRWVNHKSSTKSNN